MSAAPPRRPRAPPAALAAERFGADWPHLDKSRFIDADGVRWHVQLFGEAGRPLVLLVHGTSASTHSWRDVAPLLADVCQVAVVDLPGHGLSVAPPAERPSLANTARLLGGLAAHLPAPPALVAGHSAGAAALVRAVLDRRLAPAAIVSFNGAFTPFPGWAGQVFPSVAKALFLNPFAPRLFAWRARDRRAVERLLASTGSRLDAEGIDLYVRLFRDHRHLDGVLDMMANWDLAPLRDDAPRLETPLLLVVGERDGTVPPRDAEALAARVPAATVTPLEGLGHLAHEERPDLAASILRETLRAHRLLAQTEGSSAP